jgi:hypothetical protein
MYTSNSKVSPTIYWHSPGAEPFHEWYLYIYIYICIYIYRWVYVCICTYKFFYIDTAM